MIPGVSVVGGWVETVSVETKGGMCGGRVNRSSSVVASTVTGPAVVAVGFVSKPPLI